MRPNLKHLVLFLSLLSAPAVLMAQGNPLTDPLEINIDTSRTHIEIPVIPPVDPDNPDIINAVAPILPFLSTCITTSYLQLSTGVNPSTHVAYAPGTADPNWRVVYLSPGCAQIPGHPLPPYPAFLATLMPGTWASSANSRWISFVPQSEYATTYDSSNKYSMVLRRSFRTCDIDDLTFTINLASDNWTDYIMVDNVAYKTWPVSSNPDNYTSFTTVQFTVPNLPKGTHSLDVRVGNQAVNASANAHGLNIDGYVNSPRSVLVTAESSPACVCGVPCNATFYYTVDSRHPYDYNFRAANPIGPLYSWTVDGVNVSTSASPTYTHKFPGGAGSHRVCLSKRGSQGIFLCSSCMNICISDNGPYHRESQHSGDDSGEENYAPVAGRALESVSVFPNPTDNNWTVRMNAGKAGAATISLITIDGKRLSSTEYKTVSGENSFIQKGDHLQPGIYILEVVQDGQVSRTRILRN